jgi:hypothetical protein
MADADAFGFIEVIESASVWIYGHPRLGLNRLQLGSPRFRSSFMPLIDLVPGLSWKSGEEDKSQSPE